MIRIDCGDVYLRPYASEDLERIYAITQEAAVKKYLPDWDAPLEQRRVWLNEYEIPENDRFAEAIENGGRIGELRLRLGIILKETDEFIGWCCSGIKEEVASPNREIMFAISERYRNKGYTTQAVRGLIDYLFRHSDAEELVAVALIENVASNKVIAKSGFKLVSAVTMEDQAYYEYRIRQVRQ